MLILDSMKKSRVMKKIERLMKTPITGFQDMMIRNERETKLFEELFLIMMKMNGSKQVIMKHSATAEDIHNLSSRLSMFIGYYRGDYLPVSLVSFAPTLDHLLANKDQIMNHSYVEVLQVVEKAIAKL